MDFQKLFDWGTKNFSEYIDVFFSTLSQPHLRFQPDENEPQDPATDKTSTAQTGPHLNPQLFGFLLISIFLGVTLNSQVRRGVAAPTDLVQTAVITIALWFLYSLFTFFVCKVLGGKGSFWATISVSLQLLAVVYVTSSLITFLWGIVATNPLVTEPLIRNGFAKVFVDDPIDLYYVVQFVLMIVYLPLALKYVHGFTFTHQLLTGLVPILATPCIVLFLGQTLATPLLMAPTRTPFPILFTATATATNPIITLEPTFSPTPTRNPFPIIFDLRLTPTPSVTPKP